MKTKEQLNILLTGVPRSGTSLTCKLLSKLDNVLALQEPMDVDSFGDLNGYVEIKSMIDAFILEMRQSAIERGQVISIHTNEIWPDNYFISPHSNNNIEIRNNIKRKGYISIGKKVDSEMTLIIKHPAAFTALISKLKNDYPVFSIIRHPLWALASWNSTPVPVREGHAPMAEMLDPELKSNLASINDRIDRQIYLLSWMFERYTLLDKDQIIRYEELVKTKGKALAAIVPQAGELSESLNNENHIDRYPHAPLETIRERLLKIGGAFFDFYSREELEALALS